MRPMLALAALLLLVAPAPAANAQALPQPVLRTSGGGSVAVHQVDSVANLALPAQPRTSVTQGDDPPSLAVHMAVGALAGVVAGSLIGLYVDSHATDAYHIPTTIILGVVGLPTGVLGGIMVWSMRKTAHDRRQ